MTDRGDESLQPPSESISPPVSKGDSADDASYRAMSDEGGVGSMTEVHRHYVHGALMQSNKRAEGMFRLRPSCADRIPELADTGSNGGGL